MAGNNLFMPVWIDAYHADTRHLTTVQHGAYFLIMMSMWRAGGKLKNDERLLARIAGLTLDKWRRYGQAVLDLLVVEDGFVTQKRLLQELEKSRSKVEKKRAAGKAGGTAKSLKTKAPKVADAVAEPVANDQQEGKQTPAIYSLLSTIQEKPTVSEESAGEDPDAIFREAAATTNLDRKGQPYAFEQGVIKLSRKDYDRFKGIYTLLNLDAELISMARWVETEALKKGGDWFNPMVGALGKKQRDAEKQARESKQTAEALARKAARHVPGQAAI